MWAYSNKGLSKRAWDDPTTIIDGEVYFDHDPTEAEITAAFSGYAAAVKELQVDVLDAKYEPQFSALGQAYLMAMMAGDTTTAAARQTDLATLKTAYAAALEAIG